MRTLTSPNQFQNWSRGDELFSEGFWKLGMTQTSSRTVSRHPISMALVGTYIKQAARRGDARQLEDGQWFAEIISIEGFDGVWAEGATKDSALDTLEEVLQDWVFLKIADQDHDIPVVNDINLNVI